MNSRELVEILISPEKERDCSPTQWDLIVNSKHNVLLHRIDYLFHSLNDIKWKDGFEYDNTKTFLLSNDLDTRDQEIKTLKEDLTFIIQLFDFIVRHYLRPKNKEFQEQWKTVSNLFKELSQDTAYEIGVNHPKIEKVYFALYNIPKIKAILDKAPQYDMESPLCFSQNFTDKTGQFETIFQSKYSEAFHKNFMHLVELYQSSLHHSKAIIYNLSEQEEDFLEYLLCDFGKNVKPKDSKKKKTPPKDKIPDPQKEERHKQATQTNTVNNLMKKDRWEEIDFSDREKLWELISKLIEIVPSTPSSNSDQTQISTSSESDMQNKNDSNDAIYIVPLHSIIPVDSEEDITNISQEIDQILHVPYKYCLNKVKFSKKNSSEEKDDPLALAKRYPAVSKYFNENEAEYLIPRLNDTHIGYWAEDGYQILTITPQVQSKENKLPSKKAQERRDYSRICKYIRIWREAYIQDILDGVREKLFSPYTYRIAEKLNTMYSFYDKYKIVNDKHFKTDEAKKFEGQLDHLLEQHHLLCKDLDMNVLLTSQVEQALLINTPKQQQKAEVESIQKE